MVLVILMLEIFPDGMTAPSELEPASPNALLQLAQKGAELAALAARRGQLLVERYDDGAVTVDVDGGYYVMCNGVQIDEDYRVGVGLSRTVATLEALQEAVQADVLLFDAEPFTHTVGSADRLLISADVENDFLPAQRHVQHTIAYRDGVADLHETVAVAYYGSYLTPEPPFALSARDPQTLCMRAYEASTMHEWIGRLHDSLA